MAEAKSSDPATPKKKLERAPRFWGQPSKLSLFVVLCFSFAHMNNLQFLLNILGAENIFVPVNAPYINFWNDANCKLQTLSSIAFGCCSENV